MKFVQGCRVFDYTSIFSDGNYSFAGAVVRRLLIELMTVLKGLRVDVVHYIYPEGTVFISPLVLKHIFGKKVVMTFHLSPKWYSTYPARESLLKKCARRFFQGLAYRCVKTCDHAISLTTDAAAVYAKAYGLRGVSVVPHGIVVGPQPPPKLVVDKQVCIVGRNYRDIDFINAVLGNERAHGYTFHLVGVDFDRIYAPAGVAVHVHRERLSHAQYAEVLDRCLVMLLPLTFATANNAILEAYLHKVFVLTTRAGMNEDYLSDTLYEVQDPQAFFDRADKLFAGAAGVEIQEALMQARKSATDRFGWPGVVRQLYVIYDRL
ncbi:glycosyltransferase [Aquabacterium soli]|nr:glycosyltransferase [Aquabacterium soli]